MSPTLTKEWTAAARSRCPHKVAGAAWTQQGAKPVCVCVFSTSFMSDFDIMLAKRKAMNSRKRRHRDGGTFISDADDVVSAMITKMNEAAEVSLSQ